MTKTSTSTRILTFLACASVVSLVSACGTPNGGYYDANGNYIATDTPHNISTNAHSPLPGGTHRYHADTVDYYDGYYQENSHYSRRGYYDDNGNYIAKDSALTVPQNMFPPRGMCRVWFTDRATTDQPDIESCNGIRSRVPAGAYVIYGG